MGGNLNNWIHGSVELLFSGFVAHRLSSRADGHEHCNVLMRLWCNRGMQIVMIVCIVSCKFRCRSPRIVRTWFPIGHAMPKTTTTILLRNLMFLQAVPFSTCKPFMKRVGLFLVTCALIFRLVS